MWKLKATFEKCIRKKKRMKSRERKKIHPTSQKRMRKVRNGRDLKMRKVVSELSPVWKMSRIWELFREHIICKHNKFKFYIPVNVVIRELVGGIGKTHGRE